MKFLKNKLTRRVLAIFVVGIVGYFFYNSLSRNWQAVQSIDFSFNWLSAIAIVLFILAVAESGRLWGKTLNALTIKQDKHIEPIEAVRVQIISWLLKYIPGQAGSAVSKVVWAKNNGYSKKLVLITFIYENIFLLVASFLLSVPLLLIVSGGDTFFHNPIYILIPIVSLLLAGFLLNDKSMHTIMNFAFSKILKQPVSHDFFLTNRQSFKLQIYYLLPRILNAIGFVFVVISFLDISVASYIPLGAIYILAGAVGLLAIFVPSGIGVREAVIAIFAVQFMDPEQAIIVAIVARLYSTVADGVLAIMYFLLNLKRTKEAKL